MQVKEIKSEGLKVEMEVTVPANDIRKQQEVRLKEVGKTAKVPGFRPGKIPMKMLEQKYGRAVMGEVLDIVVNDATAKALKEKNIRPAMQPKIEVTEFDEGKDLTFKVELEKLLADVSIAEGERFDIKSFHDRFRAAGSIPISLIRWEMTGKDDEVKKLLSE